MAYVIDRYNRFDQWDREHSVYVFEMNEQWFAVKEVGMEWGLPQLPMRMNGTQDWETQYMHVYDTQEDAMKFVFAMKARH